MYNKELFSDFYDNNDLHVVADKDEFLIKDDTDIDTRDELVTLGESILKSSVEENSLGVPDKALILSSALQCELYAEKEIISYTEKMFNETDYTVCAEICSIVSKADDLISVVFLPSCDMYEMHDTQGLYTQDSDRVSIWYDFKAGVFRVRDDKSLTPFELEGSELLIMLRSLYGIE